MVNALHHRKLAACVLLCLLTSSSALATSPRRHSPFVSPQAGSSVPANPTLYLFDPYSSTNDEIIVSSGGKSLPVDFGLLDKSKAFSVYHLVIESGDAKTFTVSSAKGRFPPQTYLIDEHWVPDRKPVEIRRMKRQGIRCFWGAARSVDLTIEGSAPAYLVEWTASTRQGKEKSGRLVFPSSTEPFFDRAPGDQGTTTLQLGFTRGLGSTIPGSKARLSIRVSPVLLDGSTGDPVSVPHKIKLRHSR